MRPVRCEDEGGFVRRRTFREIRVPVRQANDAVEVAYLVALDQLVHPLEHGAKVSAASAVEAQTPDPFPHVLGGVDHVFSDDFGVALDDADARRA